MAILIFLVILSILIIAHEFGHFLAARQAGVKVEKFAIGFGPKILDIKGKETQFLVCLFPFGGYVKLAGDTRDQTKGRPYEFLSKPVGVKMRIVFAGPLFNYILAFIIFWIVAMVGFPYLETVVGGLLEGYPAESYGLKEKDRILEVNGTEVSKWSDMTKIIYKSEGSVDLKVQRGQKTLSLNVPLTKKEMPNELGKSRQVSMIGISAPGDIKIERYNLFSGFLKAGSALFERSRLILRVFASIITGEVKFKDAVAGPLGIYYATSEAVKIERVVFRVIAVLNLIGVLSVSLTIVNLFPFPILDGGHLFIFSIEKLRKKQINEKTEDVLTRVGFAVLGVLIIFIFYNDIVRFGSKIWGGDKKSQISDDRSQKTEDR